MAVLSRRRFLRGDFSSQGASLRPPWALPEHEFVGACTRCDDCLKRCPTSILVRGSDGFPSVDFARGECTFCGECVAACADGALRRKPDGKPWFIHAAIGAGCLARQRVVCRTCGDFCEAGAIGFSVQPGGVAMPQVDDQVCIGCGACVAVCPTRAVSVTSPDRALAA